MRKQMILSLAALAACSSFGEIREVAYMTAVPADEAPVIDGALDDAAWRRGFANDRYYRYWTDDPERSDLGTTCVIVYDDKGVYVGIRNPEPHVADLRQHVRNDNDMNIWMDDCAEIHFDPAAKAEGYYKYTVNSLGCLATSWRMDAGNFHDDWLSPGARKAAKVFADRWELELFVPWKDLRLAACPAPGTVWLFSHNRFRFAGGKPNHTTTSPGGTYQKIDFFTYLHFSDGRELATKDRLGLIGRFAKPIWAYEADGHTFIDEGEGLREDARTIGRLRADEKAAAEAREAKARADAAKLFAGEPLEPLALPLAGTYDFTRPAAYDGFNGFYRHNPDESACVAVRHGWKTDGSFRPKVLFLTGFGHSLRDAVETKLRFPVEASYFPGNFGAGGPYEIGVSLGGFLDKSRQFESLLARKPEVVVFDAFPCGTIPLAYRVELLRRVRDEGLSLVFLSNGWSFNDVFAKAERLEPSVRGERVVRFGKGLVLDAGATMKGEPWSLQWQERYERRQVAVWNLLRRARGLPVDEGMVREAEALVAAASDLGGLSFGGGDVVPEDGTLTVPVALGEPAKGDLRLEVSVSSLPYGDVWRRYEAKVPAGAASASFTLGDGHFPTLAGVADARLVAGDGRLVAQARKVYHYPNHRFEDYTLVSWDGPGDPRWSGAASAMLAPKLVEEFGYHAALGARDGVCNVFNVRPVPYRCRVNLLRAKNGGVMWPQVAGFARQNPKFRAAAEALGEETNPYDPAVQRLNDAYFEEEVKAVVPYGVSLWDLGDECGVVYDAGHGPADAKPFAAFLEGKYGDIANFNRLRGTTCRDFSEAPHLPVQTALERRDYPAWLDHMEYMDRMYADAFHRYAEIIRRHDPKARIGAEGSEPGDLEQTVRGLDFWGPYRNLVADETLRCIRPDAVRGLWWGGYIQCMRSGYPLEQWEGLLSGTINADLFFQMDPGLTLSAFGGDLEYAPYVKRMLPYLKQIRRGLAQTLMRVPFADEGWACYRSQLSLRAGQLGGGFRAPDMSVGGAIRSCYCSGRAIRIVTNPSDASLKGLRALFLCGTTALADDEAAALRAFAAAGGVLFADCEPGVLDRYFRPVANPPLKGLWRPMPDLDAPAALEAALASCGVASVPERLSGLPSEETVFRVRRTPGMRLVGFKSVPRHLGSRVTVELGAKGFVYETDGRFLGETDRIDIASLDIPFKLYSVFDRRPEPPAFGWRDGLIDTARLRPGAVYRLEIEDPDGCRRADRERVFVADGRPQECPFALSDRAGIWKAILRDIACGLESAAGVRLGVVLK